MLPVHVWLQITIRLLQHLVAELLRELKHTARYMRVLRLCERILDKVMVYIPLLVVDNYN